VTSRAQRIDFRLLVKNQLGAVSAMNEVAGGARNVILGVTTRNAANGSAHVEVAGQADPFGLRGFQLGRLANVGGVGGFGVHRSRAVAGLTTVVFPAPARITFDHEVGTLLELVEDLFVAGLAGIRAGVGRRLGRRRGRGCREACGPSEEHDTRNQTMKGTARNGSHGP